MNMTTPTNEEVRRQFEAWAVDRRMSVERDERHGYYLDDTTQDAWIGYQAALSSPAVAGLVEALREAQWDCHGKCPVCAGFMVGPYGETRHAHTPECPVGTALAQYATLAKGEGKV
jgi:hypothetical protein